MLNIGDQITYTTSKGTFSGVVSGRNWSFDHLLSYMVMYEGDTIPVDPSTFKSQLAL